MGNRGSQIPGAASSPRKVPDVLGRDSLCAQATTGVLAHGRNDAGEHAPRRTVLNHLIDSKLDSSKLTLTAFTMVDNLYRAYAAAGLVFILGELACVAVVVKRHSRFVLVWLGGPLALLSLVILSIGAVIVPSAA